MNKFWDNLRDSLARLNTKQKIQLGVAAATTLGLVWGISLYATRVSYQVIYTGLEREDASAVVAAVAASSTPSGSEHRRTLSSAKARHNGCSATTTP